MKKEHIKQIQLYILEALCHPIDNGILISLYYQIGYYLCNHHIPTDTFKVLEWELQKQYGIVIGFTKRNLISMMHFYRAYSKIDFSYIKCITWHQHLYLLKTRKLARKKMLFIKGKNPYRLIVCKKKCLLFIQIDYMLTEFKMLQKKL